MTRHLKLKTLVERMVYSELKPLLEKKTKVWSKGDVISQKKLESLFGVFHISNNYLGMSFMFTPRIPKDPWEPIEDDFTKRVSLAPSITKAIKAVDETRPFVYAGDIKGYVGDEIESLDLAKHISRCPKSPGNPYDEDFDILDWLDHQDEVGKISKQDAKKLNKIPYPKTPKKLPPKLKNQFFGCVPDARETKEKWALEPTKLLFVAFNIDDKYKLTVKGAEILNALGSKAEIISYD